MPYSGLGTGFAGLVVADGVFPALEALSRDAALLALARAAAAHTDAPASALQAMLVAREAAASTGGGGGVAIPHARLPGLPRCIVLLARLPVAVDWLAVDGQPVDVLVLLLSPAEADVDHLKALARIGRTLRHPETLPALRSARTAAAMLAAVSLESVPVV
ncbi:PTS sugar transporter subunit IIA [Sandarakinorhabdus sp.]|uniref:PTS sugar transporter subunit IIA n=1 Tax=Sandarakinorhabdus sp. TaxID=1916663 RepID=UPI0033427442